MVVVRLEWLKPSQPAVSFCSKAELNTASQSLVRVVLRDESLLVLAAKQIQSRPSILGITSLGIDFCSRLVSRNASISGTMIFIPGVQQDSAEYACSSSHNFLPAVVQIANDVKRQTGNRRSLFFVRWLHG